MKITTIRSEGLSHLSYFVSSDGEAMVIDPRRDCDVYVELATIDESDILHIFETHRNEDYVVGSLELQNLAPSARIGHSASTSFKYGDDNLHDEDTFSIGGFKVTVVHTPGHTDDCLCFAVHDYGFSDDTLLLFTGDTLFVNEVGRTDLVDKSKHEEMSRKLWYSLHEKVLPLGDGVIVYPGHGAGSVCGGAIGSRDFSTIGYERRNNVWLSMDEEEFVSNKLRQNLTISPYFKRCEKLNTDGPPLIADLDPIRLLDLSTFEHLADDSNSMILDTRPASDFARNHIPKSISMDLDNMGLFAGWILYPEYQYLFALNSPMDLEEAAGALYRVGIDSMYGYLNGGFAAWQASGKRTETLPMYSVDSIISGLSNGTFQLVDVRQPHETTSYGIEGSSFIPLTTMNELGMLNPSLPTATICPAGVRSATGASIMKHAGIKLAGISEYGLKEWKLRGLPMLRE
ncbi:MAG: rhodanese-like domain-containing protein [Candidatus Thorarchaeota archaeon]